MPRDALMGGGSSAGLVADRWPVWHGAPPFTFILRQLTRGQHEDVSICNVRQFRAGRLCRHLRAGECYDLAAQNHVEPHGMGAEADVYDCLHVLGSVASMGCAMKYFADFVSFIAVAW